MNKRAFSLIELLIYIAIFSVITGLMTGILTMVLKVNQKESAGAEATSQLNFVTQTISRLVGESSNIEMASSIVTSTLRLRMKDSAGLLTDRDPIVIWLDEPSKIIKMSEGTGAYQRTSNLTDNRVVADKLSFTKFSQYPGHDTVSIDIQLTYNSSNPNSKITRSLQSAIARVSAATFDSSLFPGTANNYDIGSVGANGLSWKQIYMADGLPANPSYTFSNNQGTGIFNSNGDIAFSANSVERMRIASSTGNVGIGTTGPKAKLHLMQAGLNEPSIILEHTGSGDIAGGLVYRRSGSSLANIYLNENNGLNFVVGGDTRLSINYSGNVGIGTTNPGAKLSVFGSDRGRTFLNYNDGTRDFGVYQWDNGGGSGNPPYNYFQNNVGIGTTAPSQKLHVIGQSIKFDGVASTNLELILNRSKDWRIVSRNDNKFMIYDYTDDSSTNNAFTIDITGNVGIGTVSPEYTLTVNGTAWVTSGAWSGSDVRWKKNIKPLESSLSKLMQLQGVNYEWKKEEYPDLKFNDGQQIGFIAQDVEKIIPEVVTTDNNSYKGISYEKLVPVLTEAIKDQQKQIEELKIENNGLKSRVEKLETR